MKAPWTEEQVSKLNKFQSRGIMHPFTCSGGHGNLIATKDGWICEKCDYTQDWAHAMMLEAADWPHPLDELNSANDSPESAILGYKSCGCLVAIDLDDTPDHRVEYKSRGYRIEVVSRVFAQDQWRFASPCRCQPLTFPEDAARRHFRDLAEKAIIPPTNRTP
jgi:hypothetical protein